MAEILFQEWELGFHFCRNKSEEGDGVYAVVTGTFDERSDDPDVEERRLCVLMRGKCFLQDLSKPRSDGELMVDAFSDIWKMAQFLLDAKLSDVEPRATEKRGYLTQNGEWKSLEEGEG